jgi:lipoyl-dependent peroxiredoxin
MKKLYTTAVTATGGREGKVKSENGVLDLDIRMPKALGGANDDYLNPEMLFAAGYAACFDSALNMMIKMGKVNAGETAVTANVTMGQSENHGYGLAVDLAVNIKDIAQEQAEELVTKAHQVCPYSNAIKGNVEVNLIVTTN